MIPPNMMPPYFYDWYDPQSNPYWAYYYQGYDPNYFNNYAPSRSRSQTPQPTSFSQSSNSSTNMVPLPFPLPYPPPPYFWYPPPFMGFRPISASRETTPCISESERYTKTPTNDNERNRRAVSCTPTCCQHAKSFSFEVNQNANKFQSMEEPLIKLSASTSSIDSRQTQEPSSESDEHSLKREKSLKSVPSLKNVKAFMDENAEKKFEETTTNKNPPLILESETETESEDETTEVDEDISQDTTTQGLHYPHQLSVIYEENESLLQCDRRSSVISRSSTLSDCSTTLMEDDNLSIEYSGDEFDEEENSNSVTVRLPLKFSFSRSKDNLVNTTVTVGESESSKVTNSKKSASTSPDRRKSMAKSPERKTNYESRENSTEKSQSLQNTPPAPAAPDVSVTLRLKSKSKSRTPERLASSTLFVAGDILDQPADCSISFSLPKKSHFDHLLVQDEKSSESSMENKRNIDSSLFTSFDALEEIKKGMAEITNSLCSKLCVMRKSALNIPENDLTYRSSSTSQIESIETDSENEENSLGCDELKDDETDIDELPNENENDLIEFSKSCGNITTGEEDETDFWSQITSANKNFDSDGPQLDLSKTSTRSSGYWFDDEEDVKPNEPKIIEDESKNEQSDKEDDVDFWKDYDEDSHLSSRKNKYQQSYDNKEITNEGESTAVETETEYEYETEGDFDETEPIEPIRISPPVQKYDDDELATDEEWTEVEVTDDEDEPVKLEKPIEIIGNEKKIDVDENDENSEYEDISEEEVDDEESPVIIEKIIDPVDEDSQDTKALVNVNSFISSTCNDSLDSNKRTNKKIESEEENEGESDSEEEDYSSAEEDKIETKLPTLPSSIITANDNDLKHSTNDCHSQITANSIASHDYDDKVLTSTLTGDLKSQTEVEQPKVEELSSEECEEVINEKITENEVNQNEVVVNVKGKISMFERAMSEEPTLEKGSRDVPRTSSKYSFRYREQSEPPVSIAKTESEVREVPTNQQLLERINRRKSMPPAIENSEENNKKSSVRQRVSSIESARSFDSDASEKRENFKLYGNSKLINVRSIEESGEEDSGVNLDFCKQISENETDSENFPELRKLSRYQRASTHSRLFKLLQDDEFPSSDVNSSEEIATDQPTHEKSAIPYKSKKIIHNVSVTRRQNPKAALEAETMDERRQRLCLPLSHQSSSGAESMSSSTTPSPTPGAVNEKLVNELVQSLLSQKRGRVFRNLPIEKLHAAAVKILQDDLDSTGTLSSADESTIPTVDSTPALTPQEFRNNSSYTEYYDSWEDENSQECQNDLDDFNLIQSKAFKALQEQQITASKKLWSVRCPRILSSKSVNKDLARVSEVRESESPEPDHRRHIRTSSAESMSGNHSGDINNIMKSTSTERQMAKT